MTEKKEESSAKVVAAVEIILWDDGRLTYGGPMDNLLLFRRMVNTAEKGILDHLEAQWEESLKGKAQRSAN